MQLQAFLRSYQQHVTPREQVVVLYRASTERHARAYAEVFKASPWAMPKPEEPSFRSALLALLPLEGNVVFFCDDQVFIRDWQVSEYPGLSLRLAPHLTREYAFNDAPLSLPPHEELLDGRLTWLWRTGVLSWGYPLSVDGHVFDLAQLRPLISALEFHSPNTLEAGLQRYNYAFLDTPGTCYYQSRVVNVPWNMVQTDWHNRHGHEVTAEALLDAWEAGQQIDLRDIDGVLNESVHQEFPLVLEARC